MNETMVAEHVGEAVLDVFQRRTQYDRKNLDLDARLESDLGIDSITLVSILGELESLFEVPEDGLKDRLQEWVSIQSIIDGLGGGSLGDQEWVATPDKADAASPTSGGGLSDSGESPLDFSAPVAPVNDRRTMQDFYEERNTDLFAKARSFHGFYRQRQEDDTYWYGMPFQSRCGNRGVIYDEQACKAREFIIMASNNYLGLAGHPLVEERICAAYRRYGSTNTGCRIIGGTNVLHKELEARLADLKKTESAIVFPSGYSANVGTISALVRGNDAVITDKFNHMSILDGCRLSEGTVRIFQHNDMADLERVLRDRCDGVDGKLIAVDGVFSMHGDICPLGEILALAEKYGARVLVDDAHATGVIGETGAGTSEHHQVKGRVDLELGTFSKTLAGVGGFVCASEEVVEYLRFYANAYVFAATIPAGVAAGLIASLDVMEREPERRTRLWRNINFMKTALLDLGFDLEKSQSAILPIVVGGYEKTLQMGRLVRQGGLFCQTVVYPGVGRGAERLRLSITCEHTMEDLNRAVEILGGAGRRLNIIA